MKKFKSLIALVLTLALTLTFVTGCGGSEANSAADSNANAGSESDTEAVEGGEETPQFDNVTIKIGASVTPHAELLREAEPILAKEGITLDIVELEDVVTPNTGVADGSLDANFFQHVPFLDSFNSENNTDLVSIGATHYEPFGLYAGKSDDLSKIQKGAKIGVPNNSTNEARALLLLQDNGILKLKDGAGLTATKNDIEENPYNIEIVELEAAQVARVTNEAAFVVLNGNYALEAGFSVAKDSVAYEASDSEAAKTYVNVIAVKEGNENNDGIKALVSVLKSDAIKDYINSTYDGAVVPFD